MPPSRKLNGPSRSLDRIASPDQLVLYWFDRSNCSDWSLQIPLPPNTPRPVSSDCDVQRTPVGPSGMSAAATGARKLEKPGRAPSKAPSAPACSAARAPAYWLRSQTLLLRTDEHKSELQSLTRISFAAFC